MKLYLKLLNGELVEFILDSESVFSQQKYEKECRTHVLTCAPRKAHETMTQSYISYVDLAKDLGYTHRIHIYRNIKIQFIKSLRQFASAMKVLINQCYVSFLNNENSYELYKDNGMVDTVFADLILSKKIDDDSVLSVTILPIDQLGTISMQDLLIYLKINNYELDDNAIIWITGVGNSLITTTYCKTDKNLKFVSYNLKDDIPFENCIDIARHRLEKY
jgi:hypothetical protein